MAATDDTPVYLPTVCETFPPAKADIVRQILERVGDKWSLLIISTLRDGPVRYTDLHRAIPVISYRMLTLTLTHLQRDGLVTRTSYPEIPPRVEYALTPMGTTQASMTSKKTPMTRVSAGNGTEADSHAPAATAAIVNA